MSDTPKSGFEWRPFRHNGFNTVELARMGGEFFAALFRDDDDGEGFFPVAWPEMTPHTFRVDWRCFRAFATESECVAWCAAENAKLSSS